MIGAGPRAMLAAAFRRLGLRELIPCGQEVPLNLGLSLHALG